VIGEIKLMSLLKFYLFGVEGALDLIYMERSLNWLMDFLRQWTNHVKTYLRDLGFYQYG